MTIKTIFTPIVDEKDSKTNLDVGIALARSFGAQLVGFNTLLNFDILFPHDWVEQAEALREANRQAFEERAGEHEKGLERFFLSACQSAGLATGDEARMGSALWLSEQGDFPDTFGIQARIADLIVVSHEAGSRLPSDAGLIESALMGSGRPTLIVPRSAPRSRFERIVIAWDGSAEAAHAIAGAMPFLRAAKEVTLVEINPTGQTGPSAGLTAEHLKRHGIIAKRVERETDQQRIGLALAEVAGERDADLMVMGAYVHRPWRHMLHGSASSDLIDKTEIPLLMAH